MKPGSSHAATLRTLALVLPFLLLACPKRSPSQVHASDAAPEKAAANGEGGTLSEAGASGDDVEPVYPIDSNAPPMPLAQKLCEGLAEMPEKKRATCCGAPPSYVGTAECTRTLSAALRFKAVTTSEPDIDACLAAFDKTLDGCDWVGPLAPSPPAACQNIVKGLLSEGARCRSSLECTGSLRCKGVGPTTAGKCSSAKPPGELCGGTVDTLAMYVRQTDLDKQHPECSTGHCIKHRCAFAVGEDGPCQISKDCMEGLQCLSGPPIRKVSPKASATPPPLRKCVRRKFPREGEVCPGGVCVGDLSCIMNKCTSRKGGGQDCTSDLECRGGCVKTGGASKGKCGPRCDIR